MTFRVKLIPMSIRPFAAMAAFCFLITLQLAGAAVKPSDPQIAHFAYTAVAINVEAIKLTISKLKNKDILEFAEVMLRDHDAMNAQALDLVKKLNVTPEDNDISKSLSKAAADERAKLATLDGAAFDVAYVENEVAYHKHVNGALEALLIPSASIGEFKTSLETGLKIFKGHELHADYVAASL